MYACHVAHVGDLRAWLSKCCSKCSRWLVYTSWHRHCFLCGSSYAFNRGCCCQCTFYIHIVEADPVDWTAAQAGASRIC